jgi:hypothetical protein
MTDTPESFVEGLKDFFPWSREKVVEMPFSMAIFGYMMQELNVPDLIQWGTDSLVWHYTNASGLLGILKSHRLWCTKSDYLNDPTEGRYTLDRAQSIMNKTVADGARLDFLAQLREQLDRPDESGQYVACFCRDGDQLGQWRGYGNYGAGYSIGFDLKLLVPHIQIGWLLDMSYDEEHLDRTLSEILQVYYESLDHGTNARHLDDLSKWCASAIKLASRSFKHPSYKQEQEVRLLLERDNSYTKERKNTFPGTGPVNYRVRGDEVVPYVETALQFTDRPEFVDRLPISQIVVGPG